MKLIKLAPQLLAARLRPLTLAVLALLLLVSTALAQQGAGTSSAFNYQGQIFDGEGQPVNSTCDFVFHVYDQVDSQSALASRQIDNVIVENGLFSLSVDFGIAVFNGDLRWLASEVRCGDEQVFDALNRQPINSVPYAIYAYSVDWENVKNKPDLAGGYTAGTGLSLTGTEFSIPDRFRLPQTCAADDVPEWSGNNWGCRAIIDATEVYTTGQVDTALALKLDAADHTWSGLSGIPAGFSDGIDNTDDTVSWTEISGIVGTGATNVAGGDHAHDSDYYTQSQMDTALALKLDSTQVYTTAEMDAALALKLDAADLAWSGLSGIPAGFADGVDNADDTVSWTEISGIAGTGASNVAVGNHAHDSDYYTQSQMDTALALKLDAADAYTAAEMDTALALKIDATQVYTTTQIDSQVAGLQADIDTKIDATQVYTTTQMDAALALKLDAADHTWANLSGIPAGFADGTDATDDTVSWSEISGIAGTGASNVAVGNHAHDSDYYTQSQMDTALALKLDAADAYTAAEMDTTLALKIDATQVYTTAQIDSQVAGLQADIDTKIDAAQVYTTAEMDAALALKLDAADHTWSNLSGIPAGFADGTDATDDTVSWSEISGIVGTASTNVAQGNHAHTYADPTNGSGIYLGYKPNNVACAANQVLKWDATNLRWICGTDSDAGGDITGVTAGTGLSGGGASGTVTLNASFAGTGAATTIARSDHNHDAALALKLDAADHTWSNLSGIPAGFADGTDATDDTVSWAEISGIVGTGASNVAQGSHTHTYAAATNGSGIYLGYKPNNTACATNQVLKWDTTNARWICGDDSVNTGDITGVTAGSGLTGGGAAGTVTLNASFGGSGSATTIARSDHNHDSAYVNEGQAGSVTSTMLADGTTLAEILDDDGSGSALDADRLDNIDSGSFFILNQNETVSGRPAFNGGVSGSASPFTVDSNTVVSNLNADLLDGQSSAAFAASGHSHSNYVALSTGCLSDRPNLVTGWTGNSVSAAACAAAVLGGGTSNRPNIANANYSAVVAGASNTVEGEFDTVLGGIQNTASGGVSTVIAGYSSSATGYNSMAMGSNAHATHQGAFVWADTGGIALYSNATNSLTFRAVNGYRLFTNPSNTAGVSVAAGGGSWASISDRNQKENLEPVDTQAVLEQVGRLPLSTWNYISQDDDIRHMGPMAQDFHAAFGVGENDTTITAIDGDGVSLAAIQALYERLLALEAENEALKVRLDSLERQ